MPLGGTLDRRAVERRDLDAVAPEHRDLAVVEEDDVARVGEQRGDVARAEHLALADADDERAVGLRDHDLVGCVARDDGDAVGAAHLLERSAHGVDETRGARGQRLVDEVRDDLGVGVAAEPHALGLELPSKRDVVLDDAVVDHGDAPRDVRMGVRFAGTAVRRPARVADAGVPRERALLQRRFEVRELADGAHDLDARLARAARVARVEREAGGVVTAVLEAPQPLDENGRALFFANVANDSAHAFARAPSRTTARPEPRPELPM